MFWMNAVLTTVNHNGNVIPHSCFTNDAYLRAIIVNICFATVLFILSFIFISHNIVFDIAGSEGLVIQAAFHFSDLLFASYSLNTAGLTLAFIVTFCGLLIRFFRFKLARFYCRKTATLSPLFPSNQPIQLAHGCRAPPCFNR